MTRPRLLMLRRLVLIGGAAWILFAPALNQVLHLNVPWANKWRMYTGAGRGVCEVTWRGPDREPLDALGLLYTRSEWWRVAPHQRRTMKPDLDVKSRKLCNVTKLPYLTVDAVCAENEGWVQARDATRFNCPGPGRR